ncbi:MAG: hypothetical protein ACLTS6_13585 [Anaerobutyricum sp.]
MVNLSALTLLVMHTYSDLGANMQAVKWTSTMVMTALIQKPFRVKGTKSSLLDNLDA